MLSCLDFMYLRGSGHSRIELVRIVRLLMERRSEWGVHTCTLHIDVAHACDCFRHAAILWPSVSRGVPIPIALAYIREGRRAQWHSAMEGGAPTQ